MLPAIERLLEDGHELMGVFSFEVDNIFNFNTRTQALAQSKNVPFILSAVEDFHMNGLIDKGTDVFLSAGYPRKIPPIDEERAEDRPVYCINVHPTFLPKARGLMPIPRIIMDNIDGAAGFTAHKITEKFDAGDILLQEKFSLSPRETVESYTAKIAIRAPEMFSKLMSDLPSLWENAMPQNEALSTTLRAPDNEERVFNWETDVENIDRIGRAFGCFGSLAHFDEQLWVVYHYDFWKENHDLPPGTVAARLSREITIAAKNGFVCLKNFQAVEPEANLSPA